MAIVQNKVSNTKKTAPSLMQQISSPFVQAGKDIASGIAKAGVSAAGQTAQQFQQKATQKIQTGTQTALSKIGVKPVAPAPVATPSQKPTLTLPKPEPVTSAQVSEVAKKSFLPIIGVAIAIGLGIFMYSKRNK